MNINEIKELETYFSDVINATNQTRPVIEQKIAALAKQHQPFITDIFQIINMPSSTSTHAVKLIAAIYLRNLFKQLIDSKTLAIDQISNYLSLILVNCCATDMDLQIRENLSLSVVNLLTISTEHKLGLLDNIMPNLVNSLRSDNIAHQCGSLLYSIALISPLYEESCISKYLENILPLVLANGLSFVETIQRGFELQEQQKNTTADNERTAMMLEILSHLVKLVETVTDKVRVKCKSKLKLYASSFEFAKLSIGIVRLTYPLQAYKTTLLSLGASQQINSMLNKIKCMMLTSTNYVMKYIYDRNVPGPFEAIPFVSIANDLVQLSYNSLTWLCVDQFASISQFTKSREYTDIIVELLKILMYTIDSHYHYSFYATRSRKLIVDIIFPLMVAPEEERQMMLENPEGFVALALDTCERQESETYKSQSAQLIEGICEHVDGCLTFTAALCSQILSYVFSEKKSEELSKYTIIQEYSASHLFKYDAETLAEVALIIITDISYLTPKRKDIYALIEVVLQENVNKLFSSTSTLVKSRLALMMGYYADNMYTSNNQMFMEAFRFLIKGMGEKGANKSFALQCVDTLKTIINDSDVINKVQRFVNSLMEVLSIMVLDNEISSFFDVVMLMITTYASVLSKEVLVLLRALVQRVEKEMAQLKQGGCKSNIYITGCWNVIRAIVEQDSFHPVLTEEIEKELYPMMNYLEKPEDIEFDDDILQAITTIIKKKGQLSSELFKVFPCFQNFYRKYKGVFGDLLSTLNAFMFYGRDLLSQNPVSLEAIKEFGCQSLFNTCDPCAVNNFEGAVLLQLLLQTFGNGKVDMLIEEIITKTVNRIKTNPQTEFLTRELVNVILCSFCNNSNITYTVLGNTGFIPSFVTLLIKMSANPFHSYDRRVLLIGISEVVRIDPIMQFILPVFEQLLINAINLIKTQNTEESTKFLKKDKKQITLESSSDSDSDDDDEDDIMDIDIERKESNNSEEINDRLKTDVNMTLNLLQCQIKLIDEYSYFASSIKVLLSTKQEIMMGIINKLSKENQDVLSMALNMKRVNINAKAGPTSIGRRIVKAKKPTKQS